jgi:L-lactate dehydrogenase complex protein LldG
VNRERFLAAVRASTTTAALPTPPAATTGSPDLPEVDLVDTFCARLGLTGGHAHRCGADEAASRVLELLTEHHATAVLAWDELPVPGLTGLLQESGVEMLPSSLPGGRDERAAHIGGYLGLAAGLTGADAGLAESGSVVLSHGPGRPRLASLAPEVHIALLPASRMVRSLAHLLAADPGLVTQTANLVVITGPSRTADIEQRLTIGVHGPRHIHVIVIEDA